MELIIEEVALYVYPFFIALIFAEFLFAKHLFNLKESLSSFTIAGVSSLIAIFTKVWALGVFFLVFEFSCIWKDIKRTPAWKDKLKYIFWPPGWSHDGSTLTARQMQAAYAAKTAELGGKRSETFIEEDYRERMTG